MNTYSEWVEHWLALQPKTDLQYAHTGLGNYSFKSSRSLLQLGDLVVSKSKIFDARLGDTYEAVLKALRSNSFEINSKLDRRITASVPPSIFSWGEDIEISLEGTGTRTKVTVSSRPKAQIFDWGKSEENIDRLIASLDRMLVSKTER